MKDKNKSIDANSPLPTEWGASITRRLSLDERGDR